MSKRSKKSQVVVQLPEKPRYRVPAGRRVMDSAQSSYVHQRAAVLQPYEAGQTTGRRGFIVSSGGPNSILLGRLDAMRNDSRDIIRKSAHAAQLSQQMVNSVIGTGIRPLIKYPDLAEIWENWTDEADSRGQTDFYGLQALAFKGMFDGGDSFTRMRSRLLSDTAIVPLQLQVLEAEHVPSTKNMMAANGNPIIGGVERNFLDRPVGYWMYKNHPTDYAYGFSGTDLMEVRVPAEDVCHMFNPLRPGQVRGEPWLSRAVVPIRQIGDYKDAERMRKTVTTLVGGYIRVPLDDDGKVPAGVPVDGEEGTMVQALEPGTFVKLPPGYDVEYSNPPDISGNYEAYMRNQEAEIAVAGGAIYELLTGDWRGLSDRQYRAAMLEVNRLIENLQHHIVVFQFCRPIWKRFLTEAILSGAWKVPEGVNIESLYRIEWTPPARGHTHPVQEITAYVQAILAGIMTRKQAAAELGYDVSEIDLQNAIDKARADTHGLRLSTYLYNDADAADARKTIAEIALKTQVDDDVAEQVEKWTGEQDS